MNSEPGVTPVNELSWLSDVKVSGPALMPCAPISSSIARMSASGNTPCLRIGAKVTTRTPGRERPS